MAKVDIKMMATQIVELVGGKENISSISHCSTRLRLYIKDDSKMNIEKLKKIKGVIDVVKATDQYQIIVGQIVSELCDEVRDHYGIGEKKVKDDSKGKKGKGVKGVIGRFLELLAGCMSPIVPALSAAGFIKVLLILATMSGLLSTTDSTYKIFYFVSDAVFYFLPVLVAYTSAKRFDTNEVLAMVLATAVLHPDWLAMVAAGKPLNVFGLPVTLITYSGSILPIILSVWIMSKLDKVWDKIIPSVVKGFLKPLLTVITMAVIILVVTGPSGIIVGRYLAIGVMWLSNNIGFLAVPVLTFFGAWIGLTGMHLALIPIAIQSITSVGYDSLILIWFLCFTVSAGAVALAVSLKTKNRNLRSLAIPAAISGLFGGISEPTTYGISLKMKTPFYANIFGSTVAATFAGVVHLKAYVFGAFSLTGLPSYFGTVNNQTNFRNAIITVAIDIVVTCIAVWVLGFDDSIYNDDEKDIPEDSKAKEVSDSEVFAPTTGKFVPASKIDDDVFSSETLGRIFGIKSSDGKIVSPIDGTISVVFQTKHAIGITSNSGAEILIHVGIDSINLKGQGLENFVKEGDQVKIGDLLLKYDKTVFEKNNIDDVTIVMFSNSDSFGKVKINNDSRDVIVGDSILFAYK